jgi:plasmid stabilization system protein ParE
MPRKIVKAPRALGDIERLYLNGVELFGEAQAERLHREIYSRFDLLAENPKA